MSARLGVFGGTFDPVHLGHLRAAETAREALRLDTTLFLPSGQPPHRPAPRASGLDRFAMLALATAAHAGFLVSDVELLREGPSYTVDTLGLLRERHPGSELFLILGSDAFAEMGAWREPARIEELCTVAVVPRPGEPAAPGPSLRRLVRLERPGLPFAASEVRRALAEGRSVRYLVPEAVADYIDKRGLYR